MCLAVYQQAGAEPEFSELIAAWDNNSDGGGFAHFADDGSIQVYKTMDLLAFLENYEEAWQKYGQDSPFILHFRLATHGTTDEYNVHPFAVDANTVVAHNGIINTLGQEKTDKRSDTHFFVQEYLRRLPERWYEDPFISDMIERYIGTGSKLVVLTNHESAKSPGYIFNQKAGHWRDGMWFSNYSYLGYGVRSTFNKSQATSKAKPVSPSKPTVLGTPETDDDKEAGDSARPFGVVTVSAGGLVVEVADCTLCGKDDFFDKNAQYCDRCDWCSWCDAPAGVWNNPAPDSELCECYSYYNAVAFDQDGRPNKTIHEMSDEEIASLG